MKSLGIDIGNSRFKSALFAAEEWFEEVGSEDFEQGITNKAGLDFQKCRVNFPEISIYLGGGDAYSFETLVKGHIFVVPNLVLIELNCILNHPCCVN